MGIYNAHDREKYWQEYWIENKVYAFDPKSDKPTYSIDTPPPTVSGKMHMGHAFMYTQMDFIARYKRMKGFNLFYPFGTDDNGLPTQILIEKMKKVRASQLGRKDFTKLCLETLHKELRPEYVADWKRIAISCDWDLFYTTIDKHSQKISQWSFIDLVKKNRAYRKFAPVMVCPKCQTAIAQVELEDLQRTSKLSYVKVPVEGLEYITFATTRPELMMACIAISVHPDDKRYQHLIGKKATIPVSNAEVPIISDDLTKMEYGTGAVYWCPYGDAVDIEFVVKHPELKVIHIMDGNGRLNKLAGKYEGMNSEQAREAVLKDWKEAGVIEKQEEVNQVVNVHERCGRPIEFVAMEQWFIKMLDLKEKWLELGSDLKWYPDHMKNRFDNWAKGLKWDWCISRQIYFGVPFPVWYCGQCHHPIMAEEEQLPVDPLIDKPPVDTCPKCDHDSFVGEKDIINTWATSSLTPQLAINLLSDKKVRKQLYPMNMRPQGHDIISFWLFNTIVKAQLHFNSLPWNDCMITGWALDPNGKKMSKSKGNVIAPQKMIDKYNADALRFWAGSSSLGEDLPFKEKELVAGNKFVNKLWNASKFCFMHLESFDGEKPDLEVFDKWMLSKLQKLINVATVNFEKYDYSKTKMETEKFFWHVFCDNYLEIVKDRLYGNKQGKRSAQYALHHALRAVVKLMAPITPHITEEVYQQYFEKKSVHATSWPEVEKKLIDENAEKIGDIACDIIAVVRKWKSQNSKSLKEEVNELVLDSGIEGFETMIGSVTDDLKAVTRSKTISFGVADMQCEKCEVKVGIK